MNTAADLPAPLPSQPTAPGPGPGNATGSGSAGSGRAGARSGPAVPTDAAGYRLSAALAVVTVAAAVPTVTVAGVLRGPAVMNGSARGTALVMAVLAVPTLLASMVQAGRGSDRALPVWLGSLGYLIYNAVMLLFATPANVLFPLYVATLSLAVWSLVAVLYRLDVEALGRRVRPGLPARQLAGYTALIAALNVLAWLKRLLPDLGSDSPGFLAGTGLTTNPVFVQDLAIWLPLALVAAGWLWRRAAHGVLAVGALLSLWVIESVGVAADQALGHAADPASAVASGTAAWAFAVVAVISLLPAGLLLRHLAPRS